MSALTSIYVAVLLLLVALTGWVFRLSRELDASQQETEVWMAKARTFLDRAHVAEKTCERYDIEILDGFPHEFAAKTAAIRKLAEQQEAINARVMHQIAGPQKSPSSVPAIQAQVKQSQAEINEAKFRAYQSAVMDALGRKA